MVITLCDEICPVFPGKAKELIHLSFPDPSNKDIEFFRKLRDEIKEKLKEILK